MGKVKFNAVKFISEHFLGFKEAMIGVLLCYFLLIFPRIATPLLSQVFLDNILSGKNTEWVNSFFLMVLIVLIFEVLIRFVETSTWKKRMRMTINASTELLWHTLHLPMNYFHDHYAGGVASEMASPATITTLMLGKMVQIISETILIAVYLLFMIKYSVVLSLFSIAHILFSIYVLRKVNSKRVYLNQEMEDESANLHGFTSASICNIEAIKGSGAEYGFFQRWANQFAITQNASIKCTTQNIYLSAVPAILEAVASVLVLGLGVYYIIDGQLTVGMLLAFQGFMGGCLAAMNKLSEKFNIWANIKARCRIMNSNLSIPSEISEDFEDKRDIGGGKLKGFVELKNVTFGYDRSLGPLIKNFSLKLEPGKSIAFVGPSGSGKSTLAKLISGLYSPWEGEILFDGKPLDDINKRVFNNSVAVIDQNIVLFDGTVSDNVKLWDESIEDFAMIFACHDAQIHEEIASRSNAYDSVVENGGKNFSGGQRQRLEIASALAKEPVVVVMDEGTSALDAVTEEKVMTAIKFMGASLIMIAHRLSTIRDCDEIVVLDHGTVVERGTHDELIEKKGFYSRLVETN